MLARTRVMLTALKEMAQPLRPSISASAGNNFNQSVKNPARAVIALLRSKPNNEREPLTTRELYDILRNDPSTKHMRIHSFFFFKHNVLGQMVRDLKIRKETKQLPDGTWKRGWFPYSYMKMRRQKRVVERIAMFKKRVDAQDLHDEMWHDLLADTRKDFENKHKELETMLVQKRAALATIKERLAKNEGFADFD